MTAMINQFILTHVIHALREGNARYWDLAHRNCVNSASSAWRTYFT